MLDFVSLVITSSARIFRYLSPSIEETLEVAKFKKCGKICLKKKFFFDQHVAIYQLT